MIDAGTVTDADELDAAEPTDTAVVGCVTGKVGLDDAAVLDAGVVVGTPVEFEGLEFTVGTIGGVDVGVAAGVKRLGVELGGVEDAVIEDAVVEDAVVGGSTGVDVLDVEGIAASGVLEITGALTVEEITAGGIVDEGGTSPAGVSAVEPPGTPVLSVKGSTPYTGTFSEHGSVGQTAVTLAQWVKRMHRMPNGN